MTADIGMSRRIKNAIVTILQGITYDPIGDADPRQPAFVQVLDNTHDEFEGYPSIRVLPNDLVPTIEDSADYDHAVSFAAIMHWPLQDATNVESTMFDSMYDLTDLVVNALEHGDHVGELSSIDPNIQDWMMNVKNARWTTAQGKGGGRLLCAINIVVSYSQDVT